MRTCVLFEPRGSMDSFEAIVLPPIDKRAEFSLIFMNTLGYIYICVDMQRLGLRGCFRN